MARVDFYVLKQSGHDARRLFCCKLAEKAYTLENTVHIRVASDDEAQQLDALLWTFKDESFVPHAIGDGDDLAAPISIGDTYTGSSKTLLINLGTDIPDYAPQFERIAEIVSNDDAIKDASRKRFTSYRNSGYTIETHKL